MHILQFEGKEYKAQKNETVLDCLLRNGVKIANSCRSGICQSCVLKTNATICEQSQKGLSGSKREAGFFLSCQQPVEKNISISMPDTSTYQTEGTVISQERITDSVVVIKVKPKSKYFYKAGQFVNLLRKDQVSRPYSIASKTNDELLEFHIRKVPYGTMSSWLYNRDIIGENLYISDPLGECYLTEEIHDKELLLIGIGTGLAPLFGVLKDCILKNRQRNITLFHAGIDIKSLYFTEELKSMEKSYDFLDYIPVFLNGDEQSGFKKGDLTELIQNFQYDVQNTTVMICGDPQIVKKLKQSIFLAGVPSKYILSDPFITQPKNEKI